MQVSFTVYPNYTEVSENVDYNVVDEATRFKKSGYQHSNAYKKRAWDGYTRLFNRKTMVFPTGLLERVKRALKKKHKHIKFEIKDLRTFRTGISSIDGVSLNGVTLRKHQVRAANAMLKQKHGVLWAATNSGKTEVAIAVTKVLDLPTLFLVKGKDLVQQTYERYKTRLGGDEIGIITSSKWDVRKFTVASADTLARRLMNKRPSDKARQRCQDVKDLLHSIDVVIIDEAHGAASEGLWNVVRFCSASYRFGLSGTPFKRGDKQDLKLIALTGDIIYRVSNKEMIEDGVSVPTEIVLVDIEKPEIRGPQEYRDVYGVGITYNEFRNRAICEITDRYHSEGKQVVIMIKEIAHGNILNELLFSYKEGAYIPHEFIHGSTSLEKRTEILEDFKKGILGVLITSVILDQGVDIPNIDVLILGGGGSSQIRSLQRIGRGLRWNENKKKLTVIDFADRTHRYLAKHSMDRVNSYANEDCFTIDLVNGDEVSTFKL